MVVVGHPYSTSCIHTHDLDLQICTHIHTNQTKGSIITATTGSQSELHDVPKKCDKSTFGYVNLIFSVFIFGTSDPFQNIWKTLP